MNKSIVWILAIIFIALVSYALLSQSPGEVTDRPDEVEWLSYENTEYGFEIEYPSDWTFEEFLDDDMAPRVNFYPQGIEVEQPIIHHSDMPNVSIFPQGVPTEGIFAESRESNVQFVEEMNQAIDFILADGRVWATYANLAGPPEPWGESAFLWARANVEGLVVRCIQNGDQVPLEQCDPMDPMNEVEFIHEGDLNEGQRAVQVQILESFRFMDQVSG